MAVIRFFVNAEQHDKLLAAAREAGVSPGQYAKALACGTSATVDFVAQIERAIAQAKAETDASLREAIEDLKFWTESRLAQPQPRAAQKLQQAARAMFKITPKGE